MDSPLYLTEKQVSALTGLSVSLLQKMRQLRKGLPYVKLGTAVRYTLEDINAFMKRHRVEVDPFYENESSTI